MTNVHAADKKVLERDVAQVLNTENLRQLLVVASTTLQTMPE